MAAEPRIIGETAPSPAPATAVPDTAGADAPAVATEHGGRPGPEPTRFGDWEKNGRCIDF